MSIHFSSHSIVHQFWSPVVIGYLTISGLQVAFHTAVSLGSYFFTFALGDTMQPEQRQTCGSLLWGQLAGRTSLALKRLQLEMADISTRKPSEISLAVVVARWRPGEAAIRADVARALALLGAVEEPGKIRAFGWPLCVVGCMAEAGQEKELRGLVARMGDLKEFGTVGQARRIVEAVWSVRGDVDCHSWVVAACLNVPGSPALLI